MADREIDFLHVPVLRVRDVGLAALSALFARYGLVCEHVGAGQTIAGSFWGECEAGLVANRLLVRDDTPIHSALHEGCHYICMDAARRGGLDTDAGGDYDEENAVCYLQILLADFVQDVGRERLMKDMDCWGYSFRLGSTRAWFESDAEDARTWLRDYRLIDTNDRPTWCLREQ